MSRLASHSTLGRLRLIMFLRHGGQGFLFPYIALYLTLGDIMSVATAGALFAIGAGLIFFVQPIIGQLADRFGPVYALRLVLAANCVLGTLLLVQHPLALFLDIPFLYLFSRSSSVLLGVSSGYV